MSEKQKPVIVFDTGIILQAAINPVRPAAAVCNLLAANDIAVHISSRLRSEIEKVFFRPIVRAKNPQITDLQVEMMLALIDNKATRISNPPPRITYPRDPNDESVINLALHIQADYIVTRDKDLLDLMDENSPEGRNFCAMFPELKIVDPVTFLRRLRSIG